MIYRFVVQLSAAGRVTEKGYRWDWTEPLWPGLTGTVVGFKLDPSGLWVVVAARRWNIVVADEYLPHHVESVGGPMG